jgi:hypothetical protein
VSTGAEASAQAETQNTQGGNIVGKAPSSPPLRQPPAIFGKSGQPDNQSTNRPKGST